MFLTNLNHFSRNEMVGTLSKIFVMETTLKTSKLQNLFAESEFNRFGLICIVLLIIGCLGGIAVGQGAIGSVFSLSIVVLPTMTTLSMLLAVAPMRYILISTLINVIIDTALIVYFAFA